MCIIGQQRLNSLKNFKLPELNYSCIFRLELAIFHFKTLLHSHQFSIS